MRRLFVVLLTCLLLATPVLAHNDTEIVMVVDRSGSMASVLRDAEGGINAFIQDQKRLGGEVKFTLVQFDTEYDVVHSRTRIQDVGEYHLAPRGNTALLDAVGRALEESDRSDARLRVFLVVTDGQENSSDEFSLGEIKHEIAERIEDGWQVVYIGQNVDAFAEASSLGISREFTIDATGSTFTATANTVSSAIIEADAIGSSSITLDFESDIEPAVEP